MPRYNHRNGSLWRFSLYGTQVGRVGAFPKLISPQFVRPFVKSNKTTLSTPKLFVKLHRVRLCVLCSPELNLSRQCVLCIVSVNPWFRIR
jgi:hypothetical protein